MEIGKFVAGHVHYYQGLHNSTIAQSNEDEAVKPPQ